MPTVAPAPFNVPPAWANGSLTLYHGTVLNHAQAIQRNGVSPRLGRPGTDFGPGFYTTTSLRQAKSWAWLMSSTSSAKTRGAVVKLVIDLDDLAPLETLTFVRGHFDADDYWSFVFHCRAGASNHGRKTVGSGLYDVVYGPVAAFWMQRVAMADSDQISFHTSKSAAVLRPQKILPL
jgi:hypothetical protein